MHGYTVIDVETTGLAPEKHDRILELAVVYVSPAGEITGSWSTLINPQRDVGPTRIHGITAKDVASAPTFAQVAPHLLQAVAGRTLVAHNAPFDLRFLAAELTRAGLPAAPLPLTGVCTMAWSGTFLAAPSRRLIDCCSACGIELTDAHSAAADALATAQLLRHYLTLVPAAPWQNIVDHCTDYRWPTPAENYSPLSALTRTEIRMRPADAWLDRIVARMPRSRDPLVESYLGVLELAMLDGYLAEHEKQQLVGVAEATGLSRGQILDLHAGYLQALAELAWADGVVTSQEKAQLHAVAALLGLTHADVEAAIDDAHTGRLDGGLPGSSMALAGITLSPWRPGSLHRGHEPPQGRVGGACGPARPRPRRRHQAHEARGGGRP